MTLEDALRRNWEHAGAVPGILNIRLTVSSGGPVLWVGGLAFTVEGNTATVLPEPRVHWPGNTDTVPGRTAPTSRRPGCN